LAINQKRMVVIQTECCIYASGARHERFEADFQNGGKRPEKIIQQFEAFLLNSLFRRRLAFGAFFSLQSFDVIDFFPATSHYGACFALEWPVDAFFDDAHDYDVLETVMFG